MTWILIIVGYAYGGSPIVNVENFNSQIQCERARDYLAGQKYARFLAYEPKYECVELPSTPNHEER